MPKQKFTRAKKPGWPKGKKRGPRTAKAVAPLWKQSVQAVVKEAVAPAGRTVDELLADADARIASLTAARNQLAEVAKILGL
jgi:hypothetical protein